MACTKGRGCAPRQPGGRDSEACAGMRGPGGDRGRAQGPAVPAELGGASRDAWSRRGAGASGGRGGHTHPPWSSSSSPAYRPACPGKTPPSSFWWAAAGMSATTLRTWAAGPPAAGRGRSVSGSRLVVAPPPLPARPGEWPEGAAPTPAPAPPLALRRRPPEVRLDPALWSRLLAREAPAVPTLRVTLTQRSEGAVQLIRPKTLGRTPGAPSASFCSEA